MTCSGGSGGAGRVRRPLERNPAAVAIVVAPSFARTRHFEPSDEDDILLGKLMLAKLEADDEAETVLLKLQSTNLAICKRTDRIACGPQSREGRSEMKEGVDVLADDLGNGSPVVKSEPESNSCFLKAMFRTRTEP